MRIAEILKIPNFVFHVIITICLIIILTLLITLSHSSAWFIEKFYVIDSAPDAGVTRSIDDN